MTDTQIKQRIATALQSLGTGEFTQRALKLFDTLGYDTQRRNPLSSKTFEGFAEAFLDTDSGFNTEKTLAEDWKTIDLLFQLTAEELSDGQRDLFDTGKVKWEGEDKETVIETYLFFALELVKPDYTRTALARITREINKVFPMPAMILFKHGNSLTLSVINRRLHKRDAGKDVLEKVTLIKDVSTITPHRAHIEVLFDLTLKELKRIHKVTGFVELHNAWQKTLDTKELNKRFYRELANWYFWAVGRVSFPNDVDDDKDDTIYNSESVIRLLTRLIFIWFIKEKNLVPQNIFDEKEVSKLLKGFKKKDSMVYYRAILQNLFFATLNQKIVERTFATDGTFEENKKNYGIKNLYRYSKDFAVSQEDVLALFKDVPFLNGGLFDCLDSEDKKGKVLYLDGFSRNPKKQAQVPDDLFFSPEKTVDLSEVYGNKKRKNETVKGLFEIFNRYKFTITENTPIEEEVALDPELLGRVFENLLASYNPETRTTARKQTGSFYTPREIVNYMVDESLKAYLSQKLEGKSGMTAEDAQIGLDLLLGYNEKENIFNNQETDVLIKAIDNCKILDPACGSGAFPMGILHKLVHVLHKLDPQNQRWKERQIQKALAIDDPKIRDSVIADIETAFANNELDYGRKLFLIENCIYGVDIQPIAIQISKLRFFISLVVDQKVDRAKENFSIRPLPNLETKFVAANSLIGIDRPKPKSGEYDGSLLDNQQVKRLEERLKDVRHGLFSANTPAKKRKFREEDQKLREEMSILLEDSGWSNENARKLAAWDPYDQNVSSAFFDPEWMFGFAGGFNVVIGNPPYGILNKKQNKAESIVVSDEELTYYKTSDYYKPAIGGMINIFRLFILRSIRLLTNNGIFSEIFPLAFMGDQSISTLRKYIFDNFQVLFFEAFPERDNEKKRVFEAVKMSVCILNLKNMNEDKPFFIRINNDRFINQEATKNYLNVEKIKLLDKKYMTLPLTSPSETDLLVKIFSKSKRFSQIGRCNTGEIDMTFCKGAFSENSKHAKLLKGEIIDRYLLRKKMSQGEIVFIDERKLANIKNINKSLKVHERIVLQGITGINEKTRLKMMIINDAYCANSLNYLSLREKADLYCLLGLLNSKLLNFVFSKFSTNSNVNGYEVERLPICLNSHFESIINKTVKIVLFLKEMSVDSSFFERLIDAMVYELYLPDEIKAVDAGILRHLKNLPELKDDWAGQKKLAAIEKVYKELSAPDHPVFVAMEKQKTVPEVRIIQGIDT